MSMAQPSDLPVLPSKCLADNDVSDDKKDSDGCPFLLCELSIGQLFVFDKKLHPCVTAC